MARPQAFGHDGRGPWHDGAVLTRTCRRGSSVSRRRVPRFPADHSTGLAGPAFWSCWRGGRPNTYGSLSLFASVLRFLESPPTLLRCSRTGASSAITSGASSASRRGGSGLPQGSHNGPQTPPRNRRATPLPFPMSRAGRRGRAAGRADGAAPPSCAGVAPPRVSKTTREHHG